MKIVHFGLGNKICCGKYHWNFSTTNQDDVTCKACLKIMISRGARPLHGQYPFANYIKANPKHFNMGGIYGETIY